MRRILIAASLMVVFTLCIGLPAHSADPPTGDADELKIVLVQLDPNQNITTSNAYDPKFEAKRIDLNVAYDDVLLNIDELSLTEDEMEDAGCFMPSIKLIYKDYTYVISSFCNSAVKFKNASPYVTSNVVITNDFVFTKSVVDYLTKLQGQHFRQDLMTVYNTQVQQYLAKINEVDPSLLTQPDDMAVFGDFSDFNIDDSVVNSGTTNLDIFNDPFGNPFGAGSTGWDDWSSFKF